MDTVLERPANTLKKVLLVDDEPTARAVVAAYIKKYCPGHQIVGQASGINEAFQLIRETKPDLIFLDIEMYDGTSFDLLDKFPRRNFQFIFTTAVEEFALRAFQYGAVDYLLKPVTPEDFTRAVDRASYSQAQNINHLIQLVKAPKPIHTFEKIALPSQEGITMMALADIIRLESDKGYTTFSAKGGEQCLVSRTIGEFEDLLPKSNFMRVHTSHLINLDFVKKFLREDGGFALMEDGSKIPIARRRKDLFLEMLRRRSVI